jgi:hypothetical protein
MLDLLDATQHLLWRIGFRFQWPCWLLGWAWDRRARLDCPAEPTGGLYRVIPEEEC